MQCNGKCHLAKQLTVASDLENETSDYALLVEAFFPLYFQNSDYKITQNYFVSNFKHNWYYYLNDINCYVSDCYHPPKQVA